MRPWSACVGGAARGWDAVGGASEVVQVGALGLVALQGTGQRLQNGRGGSCDVAALEPGVVLDADPGDCGDLATAQCRHTARPGGRQPDLVRGDAGASGGEELPRFPAHVSGLVHGIERRSSRTRDTVAKGALSVHPTTGTPTAAAGRFHSITWRRWPPPP